MATIVQRMTTPQPSRLTLSSSADERAVIVVGTIDSHTAESLLDELNRLGTADDAVLDLSQVDFIDSSGLRTIVTAHQQFDAGASQLVLRDPSDAVIRLLEITGLVGHLHLA